MSVEIMNLIRVIVLPCSVVAFISFVVSLIKNKGKTGKRALKFLALCLVVLISFFTLSFPAFKFIPSDDFKDIINNVSMERLNIDKFEFAPYEEYNINERWVVYKESNYNDTNYNTNVWFIIQPKDTYLQTIPTRDDFLYKSLEKFCSSESENEYGTVKISPVCLDPYHRTFLTMDFYGTIVIPVSHEYDLIIEYICDSNMKECKKFILSELQALLY